MTGRPYFKSLTRFLAYVCLWLALVIFLLVFLAGAAKAQARNCAPRDVIVERLAERYSEARQAIGIGSNNSMVEIFASPVTGSWTITVTMANGLSCLVASGQSFELLGEELPSSGEPL